MAIFLAAALGNVLALCVHAATWWLRQQATILMVCAGWFFAFAYFAVLGLIFLWVLFWSYGSNMPNPIVVLSFLVALFLVPAGFGLWHYRILRDEWDDIHEPILSFYAEFGASLLLCGVVFTLFNYFVSISQQRQYELAGFGLDVVFILSHFVTLLAGATFRKQFENAWSFLQHDLRPQRFNG